MEDVILYVPDISSRRHDFRGKLINAEVIKETIACFFNISFDDVKAQTRKREVVYIRQMMMYFMVKHTLISLKGICKMFDKKDHSTIIYAVETIKGLSDAYPDIKDQVDLISKKLLKCISE